MTVSQITLTLSSLERAAVHLAARAGNMDQEQFLRAALEAAVERASAANFPAESPPPPAAVENAETDDDGADEEAATPFGGWPDDDEL